MKEVLVLFFLVTVVLTFVYILQRLFWTDKRLEKRMKYFLIKNNKRNLNRKKFNLLIQMRLINHKLRKNMREKDGNQKLEQFIYRSGVPIKPEEYALFRWMSLCVGAGLLYVLSGTLFFLFLGGFIGFLFPKWWLKRKTAQRLRKFNDGLPDMITTVVGSLRAGFSFPQALQTVVEEAENPMRDEISTVLKEMQYGSNLEEALYKLKERMPSEDLELMIQAILIQRQVGGNLATILDTIVQTIRDRNQIQRQIMTLTAQGRLSGIIIGLLPVVLAIVIYFIEPDYIGTLFTDPIGLGMIVAAIFFGILGFIFIRKMTRIEV